LEFSCSISSNLAHCLNCLGSLKGNVPAVDTGLHVSCNSGQVSAIDEDSEGIWDERSAQIDQREPTRISTQEMFLHTKHSALLAHLDRLDSSTLAAPVQLDFAGCLFSSPPVLDEPLICFLPTVYRL